MAPLTTAARSLRAVPKPPAPQVEVVPLPVPVVTPPLAEIPPPDPAPASEPPSEPRSSSASSSAPSSSRGPSPFPVRRRSPLVRSPRLDFDALQPRPQEQSFTGAVAEPAAAQQVERGLGRYVPFLVPAAIGALTFSAGPFLLPGLFRDPADPDRTDRVMWGLLAMALAAVAYALAALYRAW